MSIPADRVRLTPFFSDLVARHQGTFTCVLDLGCGELAAVWRKQLECRYEGLDNRESVNPEHVGDACDLSRFPSNSYELVTAWSTIEHVKHPYMMLEEAARVSRGTVIFTTDYMERDKNGDPTHLYAWTPKVLTQLVKRVHPDCKVYEANGITVGVLYNCHTKKT